MPRGKPAYSVARGLIRMSWNKTNLYNLVHQDKLPDLSNLTLYQQKWYAKRLTRAYHGDRVNERQWQSMFNSRLPVVEGYGKSGGGSSSISSSSSSSNNGGGGGNGGEGEKTSWVHPAALTYAELERRLDVMLFRCLLAPSVYAARQVISHGKVSVNGKKMPFPSHRVKDGDVVQVKPEAVIPLLNNGSSQAMTYKAKEYMGPFLFVPEYLEVNFPTCSATFLRSPKPRAYRMEIPSPYPPTLHALAHEFYARNRRR